MTLPQDPNMLYSIINMKLRDQYPTLESLCEDLDVSEADLKQRLADAGYHYDSATNRFV